MNDISLFAKNFEITSLLTDYNRKLSPQALLTLLQETSSLHAGVVGWGYKEMLSKKNYWVLTRQKLIMRKWPEIRENITIKTWLRLEESVASKRDFAISHEGEQIGESTTTWAALDAETRRPVIADRSLLNKDLKFITPLPINAEKISIKESLIEVAEFRVRNSDIDHNMHVNNTKYYLWILDAMPFEELKKSEVHSYEINFLSEARPEEIISIQMNETKEFFQGLRKSDKKLLFTARVILGPQR